MLVGLIGEPMTGKTTAALNVCSQLKKSGYSAKYVSEYARYRLEKFGSIDNVQEQVIIYHSQKEKEDLSLENYDIVISDSPIFLSSIYACMLCDYNKPKDIEDMIRLLKNTIPQRNRYDLLIKMRPLKSAMNDKVRADYDHSIIADKIIGFLNLFGIDYEEYLADSVDNIVDLIVRRYK